MAEPGPSQYRISGNRCGHDPTVCLSVSGLLRRGKGGHPPVVGRIVSLLDKMPDDPTKLPTWQGLNPTGRRRRSEVRQDAGPTVAQFMVLAWMDVGTRRCATPQGDFLECPDAKHIANKINQSPAWRSRPISPGRVKAMLQEFTRCGYLTYKQLKHCDDYGNWRSAPALRTFTRQFFVELGGPRLWEQLRKEGKQKIKRLRAAAAQAGLTLRDFLNPGEILKPAAARLAKLSRRRRKPIERRQQLDPTAVRVGETYRKAWVTTVESLWLRHSEHAPPREKWSMAEIKDNATRITDKNFGLI